MSLSGFAIIALIILKLIGIIGYSWLMIVGLSIGAVVLEVLISIAFIGMALYVDSKL